MVLLYDLIAGVLHRVDVVAVTADEHVDAVVADDRVVELIAGAVDIGAPFSTRCSTFAPRVNVALLLT